MNFEQDNVTPGVEMESVRKPVRVIWQRIVDRLPVFSTQFSAFRAVLSLYHLSFAILTILLVMPLWVVTYLPLCDLPDHAAQIAMLTDFARYEQEYRINWFTPYWLSYFMTLILAKLFTVVTSIKIVLSLALIAVPVACAWLIRILGGNRYWVWASFPAAFSFAFYWGFFSYIVAIPIAIAFFAVVMKHSKAELGWKTGVPVICASLVLLVAHAMAWAFAVATAFVIIFIDNPWRLTIRKFSLLLAVLPLALASQFTEKGPQSTPIESGYYIEHYVGKAVNELKWIGTDMHKRAEVDPHWVRSRFKELLSYSIGKPALWDFVVLAMLVVSWPLWTGARLARNWRRWLPLTSVVLAFMLVPYWIMDTAYVYYRVAAFLIPLSFFVMIDPEPLTEQSSIRPRLRSAVIYCCGFGLIAAILYANVQTFREFRESEEDFKQILAEMEPGKRVMALIFERESSFRYSPAYSFFAGWYVAEKLGDSVPSFTQDEDAVNVPVRYRASARRNYPSTWDPGEFHWYTHKGYLYDYFIVRSRLSPGGLFSAVPGKVKRIKRSGYWTLYLHERDA
jgi:hypothetical protein